MGKEEEHSDEEHDGGTKNEEPTSRLSSTTSRPTSRPLSTAGLVSSNKDSKEAKSDADVMSKGVKRVDNTDALSKKTSYLSLYRYSDWKDISMVLLGLAASLVHGAITPIFAILLGGITNAFTNPATIQSTVNGLCVWFLILGGVTFFATYFQTWCFTWSGERQANRIRRLYFRGVLRQNIAWYDMNDSGVMTSRVASDVLLVQDAISEQAGTFLQYMSQFIVGIIVGLVKGWQMTLVVLALIPPLMLGGIFIGRFMSRFAARAQQSQSAAGSIAEEVIGSVRTVMAFGGEYVEIERYSNALAVARKASGSKSQIQAFGLGLVFFVAFGAFGLAFWYGSYLVANGTMQAGDVLTVFFSVVIGATGLGQAAPSIGAFSQGAGAATHIFEVIERKPEIDVLSPEGRKLGEDFKADIKFEQIYFNYPSRPDIPILRGLDLDMKSGQTIALVGLSGSGKSTIVQLLERFYDPNQGRITLEGVDTRDLNIQWLRSQIAIVSQEPVLFAITIAQNIALGSLSDNVSKEEIEEAAKMANAYQFITSLPQGFNTLVGERGVQLSGGQKQRIAIARALIKKPKILLLDEATSALDSGSEKVVQDALDRARKGRTTIVIAHRLSTIRDADQICVMVKGQLVEQGDHVSLMKAGGLYAELIAAQAVRGAEEVQEKITGDEADEELKNKIVPEAPKEEEEEEEEVVNQADGTKKKIKTKKRKLNEVELKQAKNALSRAFYMQRPEALMIFVGLIGAAGHGAILPLFTLIFARMLGILVELNIPTYDQNDLKNQADFWSGMFVVIATGAGIFNYMQSACLNISGDRLVERLRAKLFSSILKQDLGWFDHPDNGVGRLTTKLASDAILVESATGLRWGIFTEIVASLVTGLIVALTASWKIALVTLACFPLLFMGGVARTRMRAGFSGKTKKAFESAGQLASQCVSSIRTVAGLGKELTFMEQYSKLVDDASGTLLGGVGSALGYAISELFSMPIWALAFWYGAQLVTAGEINFSQLFTALMAIIFGGFSIGRLTAVAPNIGKAQIAAKDIFDIIDHVPKIDTLAEKGEPITNVAGNVEFKDLEFAYPLRPDVTVLTKLSLSVPAGKTVALVGQSGCGKSTLIGLLERFYEQKAGSVLVDGKDIGDINIHSLRQHLGLVSQEPVLFARSIIDNIKYGCPDATDEDVMKVAQEANIHTFVQSLPDGYNTFVGEKGSQLSGGQKQRVAIARALLRQPKILLLDEATSALDSESEKLVQAALETAMKGRTTILIAHRLSTVVAADVIAVVHKGEIVEQGTHDELLALRGKYAELVHTQVKL